MVAEGKLKMFKLDFSLENDDFANDHIAAIATILRNLAIRIESGDHEGFVHDLNGNKIGYFSIDLLPTE